MTEHLRLIAITKSILESNGYDVKLEQTVRHKDSWIDVDIVAKNTKRSIAIEVGNTANNRMDILQNYFDIAFHIPYGIKLKDKTLCLFCGYEWDGRVPRPKSCPRCKARLDA